MHLAMSMTKTFLAMITSPPSTQALKRRPDAGSYSRAKASGYVVFHSSIMRHADPLHLGQEPARRLAGGMLRDQPFRGDGVDRAAAVEARGADEVRPRAVVDGDHSRHDPLPHERAAQDATALVVDPDDVAVLDAPRLGIRGVHPARLVHVAVEALDLAGHSLPRPGDVVALGVHPPAAVVGHDQQRIRQRPLARDALVVGDALLDPLRVRRALGVVGERLRQALGVELQLAGGRGERMALRVRVELVEAGRPLLPVRSHRQHAVVLLLELLPRRDVVELHPLVGGLR